MPVHNNVSRANAIRLLWLSVAVGVSGAVGGIATTASEQHAQSCAQAQTEQAQPMKTTLRLDHGILTPTEEVEALVEEIGRFENYRSRLSARLQEIALDKERGNEDRRAAIFALGRIGGTDNLNFLGKHLAMNVPSFSTLSEAEQLQQWPCYFVLQSAGWNAIPSVLTHLREERSNRALISSMHLLRRQLGKEAMIPLLHAELMKAENNLHRENILRISSMLNNE